MRGLTMRLRRASGAIAFLGLAFASSAHAATYLVDTLSNSTIPGNLFTSQSIGSGFYAQSFVTDSTGIDDVEFLLSNSAATSGSIVVTLRADSGSATPSPASTVLDTIANINA